MAQATRNETLLERELECRRMRAAVEGPGGLVVIGGAAGIGKTALLREACVMAERAGMQVLRARASDLEREFAFGVVRQLFEGPLASAGARERAALLHGPAALTGPLFGPGSEPPDRRFTLVHSLYWLTSNISRTRPVALVVDDCHWADAPSLQFLAYVSRRREELGALLILTVRDGEPSSAQEMLTALRADPRATLIEPAPLSGDAVGTLVRSALGAHADPEFCAACARASAGNPFLVGELIAELAGEGVEPEAVNVPRVETVRLETVSRAVVARLNRLGSDSRNLARAVAVLENASLHQASALAGLAGERALRAADRLIAAQLVSPSASLCFVHPLLRRAVYERIPAAALADGHRRAGLLLAADGARSTRIGAHLMRAAATGDPAVVALLRAAAREALTDGAPDSAVRLLRRALVEPPVAPLRGEVLGELGEAEALAREPSAAEHLSEALGQVGDAPTRVRLACALSELHVWDGRLGEAHAVLGDLLDELGPSAPASLRAVLESARAAAASVDAGLLGGLEARLPALRALAHAAGPDGRGLLVFEGSWRALHGPRGGDWRELLEAGLDGGRLVTQELWGPQMVRFATAALVFADEVGSAREQIASVRADTVSRGSVNARLSGLTWGALLAMREGDIRRAEAEARDALGLARRHGVAWAEVWLAGVLAEALLEGGDPAAAEAVLSELPAQSATPTAPHALVLLVRGRIGLEQGRPAQAAAALRAAGENPIVDNPSVLPWRSLLALTLAGTDPPAARALAEKELERARWFGQARGLGIALRIRGLLVGGEEGMALLTEAMGVLRSSPARLELARTLYDIGATSRRAGRRSAARDPLREALELARECGSVLLAERIEDELAATGLHLRRDYLSGPEALTPAERRVADLAARGLTNREIAQALFVTVKTVGTHLGHIYDKLDLQGPQARELLQVTLTPGNGSGGHARAAPVPAAAAARRGPGGSRAVDGAQRGQRR